MWNSFVLNPELRWHKSQKMKHLKNATNEELRSVVTGLWVRLDLLNEDLDKQKEINDSAANATLALAKAVEDQHNKSSTLIQMLDQFLFRGIVNK